MANASSVVFTEGAASTMATPASGAASLGIDTNHHLYTYNNGTKIWIPGLQSSTTAASAAINTTETIINTPLVVPVGLLQAGGSVRFTVLGTCTASAGNASTFTARAGTLGSTSDASTATWTITSATTGTAIPFVVIIMYTIRTAGASGTLTGSMVGVNQGTTGIAATATFVSTPATTGNIDTTTVTNVDLTYKAAATTTTCTFQNVITEWLGL